MLGHRASGGLRRQARGRLGFSAEAGPRTARLAATRRSTLTEHRCVSCLPGPAWRWGLPHGVMAPQALVPVPQARWPPTTTSAPTASSAGRHRTLSHPSSSHAHLLEAKAGCYFVELCPVRWPALWTRNTADRVRSLPPAEDLVEEFDRFAVRNAIECGCHALPTIKDGTADNSSGTGHPSSWRHAPRFSTSCRSSSIWPLTLTVSSYTI